MKDQVNRFTRLLDVVNYDRDTGVLSWAKTVSNKAKIGDVIRNIDKDGYITFYHKGVNYRGHKVAYFIETGEIPSRLDHKNNVRSDNRFLNLRPATATENMMNSLASKRSISKYKGVSRNYTKSPNPWRARINVDNKQIHIGMFPTEEAARDAYRKRAKKEFGEFYNDGGNN